MVTEIRLTSPIPEQSILAVELTSITVKNTTICASKSKKTL